MTGVQTCALPISYILPQIEYCNTIYKLNINQTNRIERIQRMVSRFICNKMNMLDLNYKQRLEIIGIKKLETRRDIRILINLFKYCKSNYKRLHVFNNIYKFVNNRNGKFLYVPRTRNNLCDRNFYINSIKLYNSLPIYIRNIEKLSLFKRSLNLFYK